MNGSKLYRMDNNIPDGYIGAFWGAIGGLMQFASTYLLDASYWVSLIKAGGIAAVCGFAGVGGKYAFNYCKDKYRVWKKRPR